MARNTLSLGQFAAQLKRAVETKDARIQAFMSESMAVVEHRAKANIGHLQPQKGPFTAWAPLAPSTVADKRRKGFDFTADHSPLFRTGGLRDSIYTVIAGKKAGVGSDSPIAAYQEYGTSRIPARPFIAPALYTSLPWIAHRGAQMTASLITGTKLTKVKANV